MKTYKTQKEVEKDIKDGVLNLNYQDVTFECNIDIDADIINAGNIKANNIKVNDIKANNIKVNDITARNITARNINTHNIKAWDINARNISYFAVCFAYRSIECSNIGGRRKNSKHFCLDGEIKIKSDKVKIICEGKEVEISRESAKALNLIK